MRRKVMKTTKEAVGPVRLLSAREVAELLQIPVGTIYQWRCTGVGPTSMRVGRHVRFNPEDVASWVEGRRGAT
jgi:excisionase family DNA binding protein